MPPTIVGPSRIKRVAKSKWSWGAVVIAVILSIFIISKVSTAIDSLEYGLTPPKLPEYQPAEAVNVNPLGWPNKSAEWFHHASQGAATIPIPYQWLIALEEPKSSPWFIFLGSEGLLMDEYILRLGFIEQEKTDLNPDALPIGIAKTESIYFPGIDRKATAVGFTCAACHTGQMMYGGKRYIIDGGPAMMDLGLLTKSLGTALGQTALSGKFSLLNGRFDRFARNVLGGNDNILTRSNLKKEVDATIKLLIAGVDTVNVTEGFTRLDALNRIGNQVFSADLKRKSNYSPINAPVNYPHIWTTSWFDWVQYDGSIMQPLIRNSGEALGVRAYVDTTGPDEQRFASSVNLMNLTDIEDWIAGTHPREKNQFNGLLAPEWPSDFPQINKNLAVKGKALYEELCQGCHLPPVESPEFWSDKYWQKIQYAKGRKFKQTKEEYLKLHIIPLQEIGTDTAQANVLMSRTVDTTGLNLNTEVCTPAASESGQVALRTVSLKDSATSNYGLALGAFVSRVNQRWFNQNYTPEPERKGLEGSRPNCLQVGMGYKARPLNGIWATAPFLHNGSIPTIYDLLSPLDQRPTLVQLGGQQFNTKHLGLAQSEDLKAMETKLPSIQFDSDYVDGLFLLDTRKAGNHNTGHLFEDPLTGEVIQGRIGRLLSEAEKLELIEYLKIL